MSHPEEQLFLDSVEEARRRLVDLQGRIGRDAGAHRSPDIASALGEVDGLLHQFRNCYGLIRSVLSRSRDDLFATDLEGRYLVTEESGASLMEPKVDDFVGLDERDIFDFAAAEELRMPDREVAASRPADEFERTYDVDPRRMARLTASNGWCETAGVQRGSTGTAEELAPDERRSQRTPQRHSMLRALDTELVIAEQRLRQAQADALHDELGQDIARARSVLAELRAASASDLVKPLHQIEKLVARAERGLRSLVGPLGPAALGTLGLVPTLDWLAEDSLIRRGLRVNVTDENGPNVDDEDLRVALYRAVRVALDNVSTHTGVSEASIRLNDERGALRITVEDAGVRFDVGRNGSLGHGLAGAREQLASFGWTLAVQSLPGHGTIVFLDAPRRDQFGGE